MIIIVGLGNPGEKFKNTRHNIGFKAVDFFAKQNNFPDFKLSQKYDSLISEKDNIMLVKPQTFMNESGRAVQKIVSCFNPEFLIVVHDEIDLPVGSYKSGVGHGSAGHKGVESVIQNLGGKDFMRIRIGIQPIDGKHNDVEHFVIGKFTKEESELINKKAEELLSKLESFIHEGRD